MLEKYETLLKTPLGRILYRHGSHLEFYEPSKEETYIITRVYMVKRRGRGVKLIELKGKVL